MAFSMATAGCNLNCKFCQNWEISQVTPEQVESLYTTPAQIAGTAVNYQCRSIAYTYSEPTVFYEYMDDTIDAGHQSGIKSVMITAAYISKEPLLNLCKKLDAIKVDLKAFSETYYKNIVNGELKPVLDSLVLMKRENVWTEIVYLVVPTMNDSDQEIKKMCQWITQNLGKDVPIHFTRYHPQYLLKDLPPTPVRTLERLKAIAEAEGINFVYIGNVPGHGAESTVCPSCKKTVVNRTGFKVNSLSLKNGKCSNCGYLIPGIWI
jgi:pyruvate formate lyase activating enzyme